MGRVLTSEPGGWDSAPALPEGSTCSLYGLRDMNEDCVGISQGLVQVITRKDRFQAGPPDLRSEVHWE